MSGTEALSEPTGRFLGTGDESGTAPGDRLFRPDVEGLRAVAVALVVLYHSGVPVLSGGFVGVDVFFVISGFVITGVLLRERASSGRTSLVAFYGRRCRRIIPAASLVIVATVVMAYAVVGRGAGGRTASDGVWASLFLANVHFTAVGTDYLGSQLPPSLLQNYWSLAVEEQFYVVYPALFLALASLRGRARRVGLRARLAIVLGAVIVASFAFSVADTAQHATAAYFSPFTRAWELALGALIAVGTPWLLRARARMAAGASWLGLGMIVLSSVVITAKSAYPGSLVALPVVGAALVIAGGVRAEGTGAELLLGGRGMRWLGQRSYSLYLWHWPVLVLAAEHAGRTSLPVPDNLAWDLVALALAAATFRLVENPVRHAGTLRRLPWASVGLGVGLAVTTLGLVTVQSTIGGGVDLSASVASAPVVTTSSLTQVLRLVARSHDIRSVPGHLDPPVADAIAQPAANLGEPPANTGCVLSFDQSTEPACTFGDTAAARTMVLYGDSHAGMWFRALDDIALKDHWRLVVLFKSACPAALLPTENRGSGAATGRWKACDAWHTYAVQRIDSIHPQLLVVSQGRNRTPTGHVYSTAKWQQGLALFFRAVAGVHPRADFLGNVPTNGGPVCMAAHPDDVQACAGDPRSPYDRAEARAARLSGASYVATVPWFCLATCSPVIGDFDVYFNASHVSTTYSRFLEGALAQKLGV